MAKMDKKLSEYRDKKRQTRLQTVKAFLSKPFISTRNDLESSKSQQVITTVTQETREEPPDAETIERNKTFQLHYEDVENKKRDSTRALNDRTLANLELTIKLILWCLLLALFVVLEFGAVFVVFSIFYVMFTNFRNTPKKQGEMSAYSVFNANCEAIDGTLTAKQFEKELMYGAIH